MNKKRAFTLVEIMIVVLIIGIILAIAVPQWIGARTRAWKITCLQNLRKFDNAKDIYAVTSRRSNGDPVTEEDIFNEFIKDTALPTCPAGGTYTLNVIGTPAECSIHGIADGTDQE
ncbi:MAG: prepilin-type N-terminal cleavage/methylation domain-containing protein [Armatimonadetes bacterium]|nr:prepilin-type N-terminal cleavage/methylation domain-containing protein [Armatimonadota bacterium]